MDVGMVHCKDEKMAANKNHWSHALPGGRFGETLPHSVYLLQRVLGNSEVKSVFAEKLGHHPWMSLDDLRVILQADKKFGMIHISYNASSSSEFASVYVDIHGTCGALRVGIHPLNSLLESKLGREIWTSENITQQAKLAFAYLGTLLRRKGLRRLKEFSAAHTLLIKLFVKCLPSEEEPPVTPQMGYENVRIVEQICRQIEL
jgi:predicted dehydrogenase